MIFKNFPSVLPPGQLAVNRALWAALGIFSILAAILILSLGLRIRPMLNGPLLTLTIVCVSTSLIFHFIRRHDSLALMADAFIHTQGFALLLTVFSYTGAMLAFPFISDALIIGDSYLGFDWREYIFWFTSLPFYPLISPAISWIYFSCEIQIISLFILLFFLNQSAHAQRVVLVLVVTGFITVTLSTLFPSVMTYIYYDKDLPNFRLLHPLAAHVYDELMGMRNHTLFVIPFPSVGLVTFPSYHCIMAIAFIYAVLPIRYVRLFLIPLNIAMLVTTLSAGGHYLVDVIAGIVIAVLGIIFAERIVPRGARVVSQPQGLQSRSAKEQALR